MQKIFGLFLGTFPRDMPYTYFLRGHFSFLLRIWADTYEENAKIYQLDEVLAGIYHGEGEDMSDEITAYLDKKLTAEDAPELAGCVPVDAELAEMLQQLMDKYSISGVTNSWTKLCYYYKQLGPTA